MFPRCYRAGGISSGSRLGRLSVNTHIRCHRPILASLVAAGAFALGVGADLVDPAALRAGNLDKITAAARELVNAVASARNALRDKKAG